MLKRGKCRWCGCTHEKPCPGSCGWANAEQTLCTACVDVDSEWRRYASAKRPNMRRAFFRGFMLGAEDERADVGSVRGNPYPKGAAQRNFWQRGHDAGARLAR